MSDKLKQKTRALEQKAPEQRVSVKKNAILNMIKQLCVIVFPIITFPYVSRVLGAENYGKVDWSRSWADYMTMIAGLGITNYAIREGAKLRGEKKALNTFVNELFTLNICSTVIAYLLICAVSLFYGKLAGYLPLVLTLSLATVFTTLGTDWVNSIYEDYAYITLRYIVCSLISLALLFIFVRKREDYGIYAFTNISGTVLANAFNFYYIRKKWDIHPRFKLTPEVKKHLGVVLIMFSTAVATKIYITSDVTILGIIKDDATVGIYGAATKIYSLVKHLFNAMLIVAIPRISAEIKKGEFEKIGQQLNKVLNALLIIALPGTVGLITLREPIIYAISGEEFLPAKDALLILSVALLFATLACFFINVIMIPYGMEKKVLKYTVISAALNIVLNIILIPFLSEKAAALTTLISEALLFAAGFLETRKLVKLKCLKTAIVSLVGCAFIAVCCILTNEFVANRFLALVVGMAGSVILYGIVMLALYRKELFALAGIRRKKS